MAMESMTGAEAVREAVGIRARTDSAGNPGRGPILSRSESLMFSQLLEMMSELDRELLSPAGREKVDSGAWGSLLPGLGNPFPVPYHETPDSGRPVLSPNRLQAKNVTDRQRIDDIIETTAEKHGIDSGLIRAVVQAESGYDPQALSAKGAQGLMQLMPATAHELGVANAFDPAQNVDGGTRYLAQLLKRYDGDENKALAAYNWGPTNVDSGKRPPAETRTYLTRVLALRDGASASLTTTV